MDFQDKNEDSWYNTSFETEYERSRAASENALKRSERKHRRIIAILLSLSIILSSFVYAIVKREEKPLPQSKAEEVLPREPVVPKIPENPGEQFEDDFKDFFERFYTEIDESAFAPPKDSVKRFKPEADVSLKTVPTPEGAELSLQEIYKKCVKFIVSVSTKTATGMSWGSGIIMSSDGYVITNAHVIAGAESISVSTYDDKSFKASLVGTDNISDLAVLKIEASGLTAAEFAAESPVEGDRVAAIGNPLGQELKLTMTDGIVSAISRDISHNGHRMTLLQTNAAINEGNSGGALINMYGQVIGVTNMKMISATGVEGIGFAIPVKIIEPMVNSILENGMVVGRPVIGITVGEIPEEAAKQYKLPEGLYITKVSGGSDAEKQGIKTGDVLVTVNGEKVTGTNDVLKHIEGKKVGDELKLGIYRDGKTKEYTVKLTDSSKIY